MVNMFTVVYPLLHGLMKLSGLKPELVEVEPGTIMKFWVPTQTLTKPVIVFLHGFAADGGLTWYLQAQSLASEYSVYVPDLLFFGGSTTDKPDRSPGFQAEIVAKGLRKLGVEKCTVVGLSYGGMIGFRMAELDSDLVVSMVVSSTVVDLTQSISRTSLEDIGFSSWREFLLPETGEGVKELFTVGTHRLPSLPDWIFTSILETTYNNRKERGELLEALVIRDEEATVFKYPQKIHLLWGEDDKIFTLEVAKKIKEQLGDKATLEYIEKAGHLPHLERPFVYNRRLKQILRTQHQ